VTASNFVSLLIVLVLVNSFATYLCILSISYLPVFFNCFRDCIYDPKISSLIATYSTDSHKLTPLHEKLNEFMSNLLKAGYPKEFVYTGDSIKYHGNLLDVQSRPSHIVIFDPLA